MEVTLKNRIIRLENSITLSRASEKSQFVIWEINENVSNSLTN